MSVYKKGLIDRFLAARMCSSGGAEPVHGFIVKHIFARAMNKSRAFMLVPGACADLDSLTL